MNEDRARKTGKLTCFFAAELRVLTGEKGTAPRRHPTRAALAGTVALCQQTNILQFAVPSKACVAQGPLTVRIFRSVRQRGLAGAICADEAILATKEKKNDRSFFTKKNDQRMEIVNG